MKVEVKIDSNYSKPLAIIMTAELTDEVRRAVSALEGGSPRVITGLDECGAKVLDEEDIIRIFTSNGRIYAATNGGEYRLKQRLYEVEDMLERTKFVRISSSEIINLKQVERFDLAFTGTICVKFKNGDTTYVSRRFVKSIKNILSV